jgi:hypothetical protein
MLIDPTEWVEGDFLVMQPEKLIIFDTTLRENATSTEGGWD